MSKLLNMLLEKTKNNSLSIGGFEPVKYNNPIARLSNTQVAERDPNLSSDVAATTKARNSAPIVR